MRRAPAEAVTHPEPELRAEVARYFAHGWIQRYDVTPSFHFTYYGFGWVTPWPGDGMFLHFAVRARSSPRR